MKKFVLFLLAASAFVLSWNACQKNEGSHASGEIDDSVPMPVLFGSNLQPSISTKASMGALDQWSGNESIYVYGLRRVSNQYVLPTSSDPYAEADENAYLIRNVKAKTLTVDTQDAMKGSIHVYNPAVTTRDEYFFYRESRYYDFYAYYVDDAIVASSAGNPQPTETENTISLNVEISGAQDVMLAATNRAADAATAKDPSTGASITLSPDYVYGAYAARRQVKPNLVFDHMLSRFDFKLKAGPTTDTDELTIQSLEIYSKSKGMLIIASNDASTPRGIYPNESQDAVPLAVVNGGTAFPGGDGTYGDPIMVMPGEDEYAVVLKIKQANYSINDGVVTKRMSIKFADIKPYVVDGAEVKDTKAESGHQYSVTITVHSLEKVEIDVTMTGWDGNHGSFEIDPDELPE